MNITGTGCLFHNLTIRKGCGEWNFFVPLLFADVVWRRAFGMCSSITFKYPKIFLHLDSAVHPSAPTIHCVLYRNEFFLSILDPCLSICCTFFGFSLSNSTKFIIYRGSFKEKLFWFSDPSAKRRKVSKHVISEPPSPHSTHCLPRNSLKV